MSLVTAMVLARLDYGSITLNGITHQRLVNRLQSVLNAAARLVCNSRKYDRISPLLRDLHWLRVPERIKFRLAVLVFRCRNHTAPEYLSRELQWAVDDESRRRLRSEAGCTPNSTHNSRRQRLRRSRSSHMEQSASRRCRFTVAGNFQGAAENIPVQTVTQPTTIDFVTCLCSHPAYTTG